MLTKSHLKPKSAVLIALVAALSIHATPASAIFGKKLVDQTGCPCFTCPSCKHTCNLEAELVDAEKVCFETEEKVICIPRVVFPWQKRSASACCGCTEQPCSRCIHNGAKTRKICVLKPKSYTCPECEYSWSPKEKPCAAGCAPCAEGCGAGAEGCGAGVSCDAPCDTIAANDLSQHGLYEYQIDDESHQHPWTAAEPIVSELPQVESNPVTLQAP
tara:strand:- start:811597 stop:812244 length:648 start_codon:yes stop_codon:yes gene_type:complete